MASRKPTSLKAKALQLLAQRDHSRLELRRKLLRYAQRQAALGGSSDEDGGDGVSRPDAALASVERDSTRVAVSEAEIDEVLDWLVVHRYLDESRFVESRAHARSARFGLRRIEAELAQRGAQLDAATAESLRGSELDRARAIWARRFESIPADAAERARQARFLAGRGFSHEVIRRILRAD